MAHSPICSVEGCGKLAKPGRRGLCGAHYKRLWRYGDPTIQKKISNGEAQRFYRDVVLTYEGNDCLIWPYARYPSGYGHMAFDGDDCTVSRLACLAENGDPPTNAHEAAHSCGNGHLGCVNRQHLRWATASENQADKLEHGTSTRGERHNLAKLTEADIFEIRRLKGRYFQREIAVMFGVTSCAIGLIHRGERWGWLK